MWSKIKLSYQAVTYALELIWRKDAAILTFDYMTLGEYREALFQANLKEENQLLEMIGTSLKKQKSSRVS